MISYPVFFFLNEFGHLSYLIHKNKFQMDLNMISILTGLDEKKKDYYDTEVEISFFQGNVEVLKQRDKNYNLTPLK